MPDNDPHQEIECLEALIEELAAKHENCRKFMLAARVAMLASVAVFAAMVFGAIRDSPAALVGAMAGFIGGIVVWGSNNSTAKETALEIATAEAERTALIGRIQLHVVKERPTLH